MYQNLTERIAHFIMDTSILYQCCIMYIYTVFSHNFPSPYIERECVTATADGQAHFWDGSQEVLNISTEPRFACPDTWISAHFGSHPREVVVTDRTGSTIWDLRVCVWFYLSDISAYSSCSFCN